MGYTPPNEHIKGMNKGMSSDPIKGYGPSGGNEVPGSSGFGAHPGRMQPPNNDAMAGGRNRGLSGPVTSSIGAGRVESGAVPAEADRATRGGPGGLRSDDARPWLKNSKR